VHRRHGPHGARLERKFVFGGLFAAFLCMILIYTYFSHTLQRGYRGRAGDALVGFFSALFSDLVGMNGSSNNPFFPVSRCAPWIIAALLMVRDWRSGLSGIAAVLGVAAVVCGLFRCGWRDASGPQGGTYSWRKHRPRCRSGIFIGIAVASITLYFPCSFCTRGNYQPGVSALGPEAGHAPQAGLMSLWREVS